MRFVGAIVTSPIKDNFTLRVIETSHIKDFQNWGRKYFMKDFIKETSAESVSRNAKMHFHIASFRYFLFSAKKGKVVVLAKEYIGRLITNTFPLLLPRVSIIKFSEHLIVSI